MSRYFLLLLAFATFYPAALDCRTQAFTQANASIENESNQDAKSKLASETSFEKVNSGEFKKIKTEVGTWTNVVGKILIDDKHSKSGKQCLQLAGGEKSSVELSINDRLKTDTQLSFWAERWTSRSPFAFKIENHSGDKWIEIYNGDKEVKVGRSFQSQVKISLNDSDISRLRFSVSSPSNTGILIDDLKFSPAKPMEVTGVDIVPLQLPALVGSESSAIVKLKITTSGDLDPVALSDLKASVTGNSSFANIKILQAFYSGSKSNFRWNVPFGETQKPKLNRVHEFLGNQPLVEGDNYFWLACELNPNADIETTIAAKIESATFSNGQTIQVAGKISAQNLGVAVRNGGDDGVDTYRIPGLATSNKDTLIGVYDVRYDSSGDLPGNIDVGMSRSTNGGRTWEPMRVIMDMGSDPIWRGDGIGDPSIVVDRKTGTIWVSATWSHGNRSWHGSGQGLESDETGQWILVKSEDDGVSWSDPINITKQVKKPEWSFLLQGPGKGITMSDGTIVLPAQYQDPPNPNDKTAHRLPHSTFIYSRDHGKTWKIARGAWDDTTEAQIVEIGDGSLMINCRTNRSSKRAIMVTKDMGQTWQKHSTHLDALIEPGSCMASLINVGRELNWRNLKCANKNLLLFSNPDSLKGRNHITLKASTDDGKTWPAKHHLLLDEQGGRGYSCMAMIDEDTVGILYEGSQADMTFQRFKIADILNPTPSQKTKNPAVANFSSIRNFRIAERPSQTPSGKLKFGRPFARYMILQADQPIRVWGTANPGESIRVGFSTSKTMVTVETNSDGEWSAELPAQSANKNPQILLAKSAGQRMTCVRDVLIGEVWLCAGQSNMEWELRNSTNGKKSVENSGDPLLRLLNCPGGARGSSGVYSEQQMTNLWPENFSEGKWQADSPESSASFSAVGYYFAKRIREELDVPVGIINVSVGGTPIESWVSDERLNSHPTLSQLLSGNWLENPLLDQWCRSRAKLNLKKTLTGEFAVPGDHCGPNHSFKPGFMHLAGIKPFAPMAMRGVLWYQGESNGDNLSRTKIYDACFPLLVDDFRDHFKNENMPVAFVQLPAMGRPNWPVFREYQRRSLAKLNNVGMAVTIDTGHPTNVHPADKKPVGERLAQWALVSSYGHDGPSMGPIFKRSFASTPHKLVVEFDHVGKGLKTVDSRAPLHFEIAQSDKAYVKARAKIVSENQVEVFNSTVKDPMFVRYAWIDSPRPKPNLCNSKGIPASPFSSEEYLP